MASFVGASELYDEHSKYASDFREALDHFEAGRVCEAADAAKYNLTDPTLPLYWLVKNRVIIICATDDFEEADRYLAEGEKFWKAADAMIDKRKKFRNAKEIKALRELRGNLDDLATMLKEQKEEALLDAERVAREVEEELRTQREKLGKPEDQETLNNGDDEIVDEQEEEEVEEMPNVEDEVEEDRDEDEQDDEVAGRIKGSGTDEDEGEVIFQQVEEGREKSRVWYTPMGPAALWRFTGELDRETDSGNQNVDISRAAIPSVGERPGERSATEDRTAAAETATEMAAVKVGEDTHVKKPSLGGEAEGQMDIAHQSNDVSRPAERYATEKQEVAADLVEEVTKESTRAMASVTLRQDVPVAGRADQIHCVEEPVGATEAKCAESENAAERPETGLDLEHHEVSEATSDVQARHEEEAVVEATTSGDDASVGKEAKPASPLVTDHGELMEASKRVIETKREVTGNAATSDGSQVGEGDEVKPEPAMEVLPATPEDDEQNVSIIQRILRPVQGVCRAGYRAFGELAAEMEGDDGKDEE